MFHLIVNNKQHPVVINTAYSIIRNIEHVKPESKANLRLSHLYRRSEIAFRYKQVKILLKYFILSKNPDIKPSLSSK